GGAPAVRHRPEWLPCDAGPAAGTELPAGPGGDQRPARASPASQEGAPERPSPDRTRPLTRASLPAACLALQPGADTWRPGPRLRRRDSAAPTWRGRNRHQTRTAPPAPPPRGGAATFAGWARAARTRTRAAGRGPA